MTVSVLLERPRTSPTVTSVMLQIVDNLSITSEQQTSCNLFSGLLQLASVYPSIHVPVIDTNISKKKLGMKKCVKGLI